MREILDPVDPEQLRAPFKGPIRQLQRGKILEDMVFFQGCYLLSLDGTGFFSSKKLHSEICLKKENSKTSQVTYHLQMLGAAIVHPAFKEVIPLPPEFIVKQDGQNKNDCERNAAKRFFEKLRKDHPHLPLIITEAQKYNLHYILGVKEGDHSFLFDQVKEARSAGEITEFEIVDEENPEMVHRFSFLNQVPINESNQDLLVNC
jgi:hypothetical protein